MDLDLGVGKEDVGRADADGRFGDIFDLAPSLIVVTRLAFAVLGHETTEQLQRLYMILLLPPASVIKRDVTAILRHPFGVVIERVVIPLVPLAGFDCGLKLLRRPPHLAVVAAMMTQRHRDKVMR